MIEADYVIVGGGAVGMGFADVVLAESEATVIMVDRRANPGGHWNDAYSFVRLHQPSAFYGVSSTELGRGTKDTQGPNAGLYELASGVEVRAYFDRVLRDTFLPSGRVTYLPMSEYTDDGVVTSRLTGHQTSVRARKKVVDARYVGSSVPATEPPPFPAAAGVELVPVNHLASIDRLHSAYVIIGSGKTGSDACLWLLENGVDPSSISWVRPRDSWFFNRAGFQGGTQTLASFATQLEVVAEANSVEDIVLGFEAAGQMLRIDPDHRPSMFRGATSTTAEVEALGRITDVVRLGHVERIERDQIVLERGAVATRDDSLFVDCTARGVPYRPPVPIFDGQKITLQYVVYGGMPTFSAAIVAIVEVVGDDDAAKNAMCSPLPISGDLIDIPRILLADLKAREAWLGDRRISDWMDAARLNPISEATTTEAGERERQAAVGRLVAAIGPARSSLERVLAAAS